MQDDDVAYYEHRAEQELALAQRSSDKRVVAAHYELACRYLDLVHTAPNAGLTAFAKATVCSPDAVDTPPLKSERAPRQQLTLTELGA